MLKKEKYYGEIWFPENEAVRCFCVLTFMDGEVSLETNLTQSETAIKHQLIRGVFTGLGYLVFLDCHINHMSSGMIRSAIYAPKYTFIHPGHFIDPIALMFKNFTIANKGLINWRKPSYELDMPNKTLKLDSNESYHFRIGSENLEIEVEFSMGYTIGRKEFVLKKQGHVKFSSDMPIKLVDALSVYDTFQQFIQFGSGQTKQFDRFSFQCLDCDQSGSLYFQENNFEDHRYGYLTTDFNELLPNMQILLDYFYKDTSFLFCVNKLLENHKANLTHSKRFTNSISSFEAYSKHFCQYKNTKLSNYLNGQSDLIMNIGKIPTNEINDYIAKVVKSRDYHVHSNVKNQNIFSDFELRYVSLLLDFVVAIRLHQLAKTSEKVIDKMIKKGQMIYVASQNMNKMLSHDYLRNS